MCGSIFDSCLKKSCESRTNKNVCTLTQHCLCQSWDHSCVSCMLKIIGTLCLWYDLKANNIAEFWSFLSNWIAFLWNPEVRKHSIVFQVLLIHTKVFAFVLICFLLGILVSLWLCIMVLWKVCCNMCARFNKFICDNALLISSWRMK